MSRKVALLIGVTEYGEGIPPLSAPSNDVEEMKRVLEHPEMGGFEVQTMIDPAPTPMRKEIKKLFSDCGKGDVVLLFFSGHGITDDENKLYLATSITAKDDFEATAVPASFVQQQSKNSYTKRQVIILDCCYSGAFAEGWQAKSVGVDLKKELGAEGRVVLTSSTATQTSFQQEDEELSLYTRYIIEGIETGAADKDEDGKIHAYELHEYAKAKVQEVKPKQKPGIIIDREGFNIFLSQAPLDDPELNFRKLVEQYASKGEISPYRRETLKIKKKEYKLIDRRADEIIDSVIRPYQEYLDNLEKYRKHYRQHVDKPCPLERTLAQDLRDWGKHVLGLQNEDLDRIEQDINAEKKVKQRHQQETQQKKQEEYNNKLKQYEQEFLQAVEREYPLSNSARDRINIRQQFLGLKDEDIQQIEQAILATKYQERERQRQQEKTKAREPKLKKQQVQQDDRPDKEAEKWKRDKEKPPQFQPRLAEILSSKKAWLTVLSGTTVLGLIVIFSGFLLNSTPISVSHNTTSPKPPSENQSLPLKSSPLKSSPQPNIKTPSQPILVSAATGVDYGQLQKLLAAGKWREADRETLGAMLKAAGREKESWLKTKDIHNFSCEDLRIIDRLWLEFSKEKFGFSIQKNIYHNQGGIKSINGKGFNFGSTVGWNKTSEYDDLIFNLNAPKGHLPSVAGWGGLGEAWEGNGYVSRGAYGYIFSLAHRIDACKI